jgi:hypothetical protein
MSSSLSLISTLLLRRTLEKLALCFAMSVVPICGYAQDDSWKWGVYAGKYYDTEPGGFINGRADFKEQYLLAVTATKPAWKSKNWPIAIEWDIMAGQQGGLASITEIAAAPALRLSGFPWQEVLRTDLRLAPLGISYTSKISPLERGVGGNGSQWLNFLFVELAVSRPNQDRFELFARLHHRCTVYDLINNYRANGQDFFALGIRSRF